MAYGHYRNSGIPRLKNYAEALALYESTKPIRLSKTRTEECRPLGHRRNADYYSIDKLSNGDIMCRLWGNNSVVYTTDNRIGVRDVTYASISSSNFLNDLLPRCIDARLFDYSTVLRVSKDDYFLEQRLPRTAEDDTGGFVYLDAENYHFLDAKPNVIARINKKAMADKRKNYEGFLDYADKMLKLRGDGFEPDECKKHFDGVESEVFHYITRRYYASEAPTALVKFYGWLTDTSDNRYEGYYYALMCMVNSEARYDWQTKRKFLSMTNLKGHIDDYIKGYHYHEVFNFEVREDGRVMRSKTRKYDYDVWQKARKQLGLDKR